jgi:hypothetical protein
MQLHKELQMTDMDGNQTLDANQGNEGDHSADSTDAELLKTLDAINSRLSNLEGQQRALQSGKDRGIAGLQNEVQNIKTNFGEILEYGKRYSDPAEAERNWQIDQFLTKANENANGLQGNQSGEGSANQQPNTANVNPDVLQQYGIDPQSPEYLAQIKSGKSSFEASLAVLASKQATGEQGEGLASGASGGTGQSASLSGNKAQQAALKAQYDEEVQKTADGAGGYLSPRQLYFIQEKYVNQHGLDRETLGW